MQQPAVSDADRCEANGSHATQRFSFPNRSDDAVDGRAVALGLWRASPSLRADFFLVCAARQRKLRRFSSRFLTPAIVRSSSWPKSATMRL
jgi:hypothetical protein